MPMPVSETVSCTVSGPQGRLNADAAALDVIFDRVVAEIIHNFIQQPPHAHDRGTLARDLERDVLLLSGRAQALRRLAAERQEVNLLGSGSSPPSSELRKADDVVDQRHKARRLVVDMPDEAGQILGLTIPLSMSSGAADDALQRGLELVGDVCRKLAGGCARRTPDPSRRRRGAPRRLSRRRTRCG